MDENSKRLALRAVIDAEESATSAAGNGEDARRFAERGDFDSCLEWLGWLQKHAGMAEFHAKQAIERIKQLTTPPQ